MAKLGKQKFSITGEHEAARTTSSGTFELYLYYDTEGDFFYFSPEEMKKYLPEDSVQSFYKNAFSACDTKQKAVDIIESLIATNVKEKRMLRIEIGMNSDLYNVSNPKYKKSEAGTKMSEWSFEQQTIKNPELPKYLQEMLDRGGVYDARGLTLRFNRIMEIEVNGQKRYAGCDENWKYKRKDMSGHASNLIDWTPEAEKFLIETQALLDSLCEKVLNFFNAGDNVENLLLKMGSNKLLGEGGK